MVVAFIPARGGSERIPGKNIRELNGHPLLAYAIAGAKRARIFDGIYVSTEDPEVAKVAKRYGAEVIDRPEYLAFSTGTDLQWIVHALKCVPNADECVLLRPTNPFRTAKTILRAWETWVNNQPSDSLRAVREVKETPWKMWCERYGHLKRTHGFPLLARIDPLMHQHINYYDLPTQQAPKAYIQCGSIQIFTRQLVEEFNDQTGSAVVPFSTTESEGLDLNNMEDWDRANDWLCMGRATLEVIE